MPSKTTAKTKKPAKSGGKEKYVEAVGRRKTAVARVRLWSGRPKTSKEPEVMVNGVAFTKYFPMVKQHAVVKSPFEALSLKEYSATAKVSGGGLNAQAEAIRLGISRTLVALNPLWRVKLKSLGYLKRDPRMVERKKPGLRKARRPQQWRKR